ncbi:MAG: AraC family transcriptional regulator [Lentisphaeria bacterium]|nr:AraC family transcriptional regulator [Lentisphaeria bacterium]
MEKTKTTDQRPLERFLPNKNYFVHDRPMLRGVRINQRDMPMHSQKFSELIFVLSGTAEYITGPGAREKIGRGSIMVTPPNGRHGYVNCRDLTIFTFLFAPDRLPLPLLNLHIHPHYRRLFSRNEKYYDSLGRNYPQQDFPEEEFAEFEHLIQLFDRFQQQELPGRDCEMLGIFMCILGRLCDLWRDEDLSRSEKNPLSLDRITAYMARNIDRNTSLDELALVSSMSVNTLLRHFRKAFGKTPMAYIRELRLRAAGELLLNSGLRVEEVAFRCGFGSSSHFIMLFRKRFGETPDRFRSAASGERRRVPVHDPVER